MSILSTSEDTVECVLYWVNLRSLRKFVTVCTTWYRVLTKSNLILRLCKRFNIPYTVGMSFKTYISYYITCLNAPKAITLCTELCDMKCFTHWHAQFDNMKDDLLSNLIKIALRNRQYDICTYITDRYNPVVDSATIISIIILDDQLSIELSWQIESISETLPKLIIAHGSIQLIRFMVDKQYDIEIMLNLALDYERYDIIQILIDNTDNVNWLCSMIIRYCDVQLVKYLLFRHPNVDSYTCLDLAVMRGNTKIIELVVAHAKLSIETFHKLTELCVVHGLINTLEYLLDKYDRINCKVVLTQVLQHNENDMLQLLLSKYMERIEC